MNVHHNSDFLWTSPGSVMCWASLGIQVYGLRAQGPHLLVIVKAGSYLDSADFRFGVYLLGGHSGGPGLGDEG